MHDGGVQFILRDHCTGLKEGDLARETERKKESQKDPLQRDSQSEIERKERERERERQRE